jgi:hypothetical protein
VIASPARLAVVSLVILGLLALAAVTGPAMPLAETGAVVLVVAVPVWLVLASLSAVRMAHQGAMLERPVWWLWLGHPLRCLVATGPALMAGAGVAAALIGQGFAALGWIAATGAVVLLIAVSPVVGRVAARYRAFARVKPVVLLSVFGAAGVMAVAAALATVPGGGTLAEVVAGEPRYTGSSMVVAQVMDTVALWTGVQAWGVGWAEGQAVPGWVIAAWRAVTAFGYFAGVGFAMAAGLLPRAALRRILVPTDAATPARVGAGRVALLAAVGVVLTAGYFQALAGLEAGAGRYLGPVQTEAASLPVTDVTEGELPVLSGEDLPGRVVTEALSPATIRQMVEAEAIGSLQCPPGTIAAVEALDAEFAAILSSQRETLRAAVRAGFDRVRANVPGFLDWYYSLGAEYLRTAYLLVGSGVSYLDQELQAQLAVGDPLAGLEGAIAGVSGNSVLAEVHEARRAAVLAGCAAAVPRDDVGIIEIGQRPATLLTSDLSATAIGFEMRLASAGLGGVTAGTLVGVVMAKVGAKMLAKGVFTAAAEALAKIAGSKAISLGSGMLIGAGTGAAGGSVVPGAGTTAGAIVGGIAGGVAVMLGVDFTILKLDEAVSRDAFEAEIMAAIDASEADMLEALGLADVPAPEN